MNNALLQLDRLDRQIASHMSAIGPWLLRFSLAIVFIWFGALKPLGLSTANDLIARTVVWLDPDTFIPVLGVWEVLIGVCMLIKPLNRIGILLLLLQMPGTMLPLFVLPDVCFERVPWVPTLEGQYIIKNLVLISAAIVVGGAVRGGAVRGGAVRGGAVRSRAARSPAVAAADTGTA